MQSLCVLHDWDEKRHLPHLISSHLVSSRTTLSPSVRPSAGAVSGDSAADQRRGLIGHTGSWRETHTRRTAIIREGTDPHQGPRPKEKEIDGAAREGKPRDPPLLQESHPERRPKKADPCKGGVFGADQRPFERARHARSGL